MTKKVNKRGPATGVLKFKKTTIDKIEVVQRPSPYEDLRAEIGTLKKIGDSVVVGAGDLDAKLLRQRLTTWAQKARLETPSGTRLSFGLTKDGGVYVTLAHPRNGEKPGPKPKGAQKVSKPAPKAKAPKTRPPKAAPKVEEAPAEETAPSTVETPAAQLD